MAEPLIRIENVEKVYHREKIEIPVLMGINLDIPEGEFVALMGPSGSGKTTLLNLIAGIDQPDAGSASWSAGRDIADPGADASWRGGARAHIGFIFQLYNLMPVLTAFENVELPLLLTQPVEGGAAASTSRPRSRSSGSPTAWTTTPGSSRAVRSSASRSRGPSSPTRRSWSPTSPPATSTPNRRDEILELLRRLNEEFQKTIVMVTHDPKAAARAHRMIHLDKGVLHADERTGSMRSV